MRPHIAKKYLPEQDMKLERLSDNINYITLNSPFYPGNSSVKKLIFEVFCL